MNTGKRAPARRSVLRNGLAAIAGAVGIAATSHRASASAVAPDAIPQTFTLYGREWRLDAPGRRAGEALLSGQQLAGSGDLLRTADGVPAGTFLSTYVAVGAGGAYQANDGIEQHVLRLEDGMILAIGASTAGEGEFVITGGTGRYAGLRGSYRARQSFPEFGGDYTAVLEFTVAAG